MIVKPEDRGLLIISIFVVFSFVAMCFAGYYFYDELRDRADRNEESAQEQTQKTVRVLSAAKRLERQVERLGEEPVVETDEIPEVTENVPLQGEPGPPPSPIQIQQAVDQYCAAGLCEGDSPTSQEILLAVDVYCSLRDDCTGSRGPAGPRGAAGTDGSDGVDGEPGTVGAQGPVGPEGPPGPPGADGSNGTDGANGEDGVGITSIDCSSNSLTTFEFTVTYTDGTQQMFSC